MTNIKHILNTLVDTINDISNPGMIYVAIGSAAMMKENDGNGKWTIDERFEQQYPIFIKNFIAKYPNKSVHIILIDPQIEDPPFVTCDITNKMAEHWRKKRINEIDIYIDDNNLRYIYPIKIAVNYNIKNIIENANEYDIKNFLHELNNYTIYKKSLCVVHDYTGKMMNEIGKYFDDTIKNNHCNIIYGLGARMDGGCYIDLTLPICDFVYNDLYEEIEFFNPYTFSNNVKDMVDNIMIKNTFDICDRDIEIMREQVTMFLINKRMFLEKTVLTMMRQIKLLLKGDKIQMNYDFEYIKNKYFFETETMLNNELYDDLLIKMIDVLSIEANEYFCSVHGEEVGQKMKNDMIDIFLSNKNPYEIYNEMISIINKSDELINIIKKKDLM
jgi:hypothetical protein